MNQDFKNSLKIGDKLINDNGETATVFDLLPDDHEYFARLIDDTNETFCALIENHSNWHLYED